MPATLSARPPRFAVVTVGPAAAARPAHAAQVVLPSAICAPQVLQNAIRFFPLDPPRTSISACQRWLGRVRRRGNVSKIQWQSNQHLKRGGPHGSVELTL